MGWLQPQVMCGVGEAGALLEPAHFLTLSVWNLRAKAGIFCPREALLSFSFDIINEEAGTIGGSGTYLQEACCLSWGKR